MTPVRILLLLVLAVVGGFPTALRPLIADEPPPSTAACKILTWNVQMLPTFPDIPPLQKGQSLRAPWIIEHLGASDYDIIVLQEVIDRKMTDALRVGLKERYPHLVSVDSKRGLAGCTGGILFASKIPLKYVAHIVFKNVSGVDALAEKGCVLVEAQFDGVRFQIAATHLQAGDDTVRDKEVPEIFEGIIKAHKTEGVPQILLGDMNIAAGTDSFQRLLAITEMQNFALDDARPYTTDGENSWNPKSKRPKHIDHILLNPRGTGTTIARQTIQLRET